MKLSTYTLLISATQAIRMEIDPPQPPTDPQQLQCQYNMVPPLMGEEEQEPKYTCDRAEDSEQPALEEGQEDMCLQLITKEDCERGSLLQDEEIEAPVSEPIIPPTVGGDQPQGDEIAPETKEGDEVAPETKQGDETTDGSTVDIPDEEKLFNTTIGF